MCLFYYFHYYYYIFFGQDTLTLIEENPDQPEICHILFEIRTKKTCDQYPYNSLNELKKDLSTENEQVTMNGW